MRTCTKCGKTKPLKDFGTAGSYRRSDCKECKGALDKRVRELKKVVERPSKDYRCPVCNSSSEDLSKYGHNGSRWCLDHDHITGLFRGWVCMKCNIGLGALQDNTQILNNAIEYLNRPPLKSKQIDMFE